MDGAGTHQREDADMKMKKTCKHIEAARAYLRRRNLGVVIPEGASMPALHCPRCNALTTLQLVDQLNMSTGKLEPVR
jgi:hypothetical protein